MSDVLLAVRDLHIEFRTLDGRVQAVNGVDFEIERGDVFAIVGESGAGKSVTAMSVLGLLPTPPAKVTSGEILWQGEDLLKATPARMRQVRGGEIAMIFQDPLSALNPVHPVGRQIGEMIRSHEKVSRKAAHARAIELLDLVGIPQARDRVDMHPHEFSGGMRQRAVIAMAIACRPALLIADEPTTALDVTVQAQVLEVLMSIKEEIDSAILLITHDLGVVAGMANKVMVMYAGRAAEVGAVEQLFEDAAHPYTIGLMDSMPSVDAADRELRPIGGQPPSMISPPSGCPFHPRCRLAHLDAWCVEEVPPLVSVGGIGVGGHRAACHYIDEVRAARVAETQ